jgi:hypothetical protein
MTPLELVKLEQGGPEWRQARCGLVTASRCADVVAMTKKGEEKSERAHYRAELICEILSGHPYPRHVTREMQWGIDHEADARVEYELRCGVLVETCGFVVNPYISRFGCSPDGFVGDDGMLQIKCPTTATHLGWILGGTVPLEHLPQMLAEFSCNPTRTWSDFVSYDPRMPEHLQLFIRRLERESVEHFIEQLEHNVEHFNSEIADVMMQLPGRPQLVVAAMNHTPDELEF